MKKHDSCENDFLSCDVLSACPEIIKLRFSSSVASFGKEKFSSKAIATYDKAILIGYAVCVVLSPTELFTSSTLYAGGRFSAIPLISIIIGAFLIALYGFRKRLLALQYSNVISLAIFVVMILIWFRFGTDGVTIPGKTVFFGVQIYCLVSLDRDSRTLLLYYIGIVFSIAMLPCLILFILLLYGIDLPLYFIESTNPLKVKYGINYLASPFGVLRVVHGTVDYCGIYDESGCVGTFASLLFITLNSKKKISSYKYSMISQALILIEAILSFSFAAYVLLFCYVIATAIKNHNFRALLYVFCGIITYILILNLQIDNFTLSRLQNRISLIVDSGVISDNRVDSLGLYYLNNFYSSSDIILKLFGYGPGSWGMLQTANDIDASSIQIFIYNYGFVGIGLYYLYLIIINRVPNGRDTIGDYNNMIVLLLFLVSTYQRPFVMNALLVAALILSNPGLDIDCRKNNST